ncbi:hypothetical protein HMPREF0043_00050 [Actinobaculum sp. oral taxon 183 str. F0552]|nr:hypothetical protein HMPREF0043_00050 [Actinobaculum sp. oral taxon 183 str. F0552]
MDIGFAFFSRGRDLPIHAAGFVDPGVRRITCGVHDRSMALQG